MGKTGHPMLNLMKQSPIYMCNVMYFRVKQNIQSNKNIAWDLALKISTQPRSCKGKINQKGTFLYNNVH